jgi:hypothetical protein
LSPVGVGGLPASSFFFFLNRFANGFFINL